jgi:hypothetical protein
VSSGASTWQPRRLKPADRQPHRRRGRPNPPRNLAGRHPGRLQSDHLITSRTWRIASLSVGIQVTLRKSRKAGPYRSQKRPRHPGRHHPGMVGEIISEWRARSNRNGGRDHSGMVGDIERNQHSFPSLDAKGHMRQDWKCEKCGKDESRLFKPSTR